MKLKTVEIDGKTYAEVQDDKPVYDDNGKDVAFDAPGTRATISRLNGEAKANREAKEAAEEALKAFEGIEDPEEALKALTTVRGLEDKDLLDANKVEEIKQAAVKAVEEKYTKQLAGKEREIAAEREKTTKLTNQLDSELIGGNFSRSEFAKDNVVIPTDFLQSYFRQNFVVEDGAVRAYDSDKNPIYSPSKPGELASFDEALEVLIEKHPSRDHILKGTQQSGGGAENGGPGGGTGKKVTQAEFNAMDPKERSKRMAAGSLQIVG